MKKKIECPQCESLYHLIFEDDEVDGTPDRCPFCGEIMGDYLNLNDPSDEEPLDMESDDVDV